jgi:hypothetical protein
MNIRKFFSIQRFAFTLLLLINLSAFAQIKKNILKLPSIPGYELLKCDFHMHTVFSDGMVWPTTRVMEANEEGLDAIALTEHMEYTPKSEDFTSKDHLRSYQIAEKSAAELGIILIKATEITRRMAPGHFNVLFVKDANVFETFVNKTDKRDGSNIAETLAEAKKQGAFVFWNHPWFQHPENRSEWQKIHEQLYEKGLISGIEVVNGDRYDSLVFRWCLDKNLTIMSNSDIHAPMVLAPGQYRAITLVLAKEHSEKGIQEALVNHRTIACMEGQLFGKEQWVKPVVENSLIIKVRQINDKSAILEIENTSGIPYKMELKDGSGIRFRLNSPLNCFTLDALSQNAITVTSQRFVKGTEYSVRLNVLNVQVSAGKPLEYILKFRL